MSNVKSKGFAGPVGISGTGQDGTGCEVLNKFMSQAQSTAAAKQRPFPANRPQPAPRNKLAQRGNAPMKQDYTRPPPTGAATPAGPVQQKLPGARVQQAVLPLPLGNPYKVNISQTSDRTAVLNDNAVKVSVTRSFPLPSDSKLNTALSVQGKNGSSLTEGQWKATNATTIAGSLELERKFPASGSNTSITAKAKIAGEITNSLTGTSSKTELGVTVRADLKLGGTTTAYAEGNGKTVISSISSPVTSLSAKVGITTNLSADGKLKGSAFGGIDQTLGGSAASFAGIKVEKQITPTTTLSGEIRVDKDVSSVTKVTAEAALNFDMTADAKLKGTLAGGLVKTTGGDSVPYVGIDATYQLNPNTSMKAEIRVDKESSTVKIGLEI